MNASQRIARRFMAATAPDPDQRHTDLIREIDELEELQKEIESFIFLEEPAMHLLEKLKKLIQKHPDLKGALWPMELAMSNFHDHVLRELSNSVEKVDAALEERQDELEELSEQLRRR
jgi:hypothetical protein